VSAPPGLLILNQAWQLAPADLKALWWSVRRSNFTRVVEWRQQLALMGQVHVSTTLVERTCTRRVVIAMLEDLCLEGGLRRSQCSRIEEKVVQAVRGTADAAPCYAPDITVLATVGQPL
jgi:hypothetical protein